MNLTIVNSNTEMQMVEKYGENVGLLLWCKFVCKNEFVKNFLKERQKGKCEFCRWPMKKVNPQVHHIDYDNFCVFDKPIVVNKIKTTNCEFCWQNDKEQFEKCMSKLRLVHKGCNKRIYEVRKLMYV